MAWKVFRNGAIGGLVLLYTIGLILSTRAVHLLLQGKESGPGSSSYPPWTIIHFAAAFLFALLAMAQLFPGSRRRYPSVHRYSGRVAVVCGLITAVSGALIPFAVVPPRPLIERLYIVIYFAGVASFLLLGFRAARLRDYPLHRVWMIRAVASAGAVMTQRILFAMLGASFGIHSESEFWIEFVGAFALGWAMNLGFAEIWLRWKPSLPAEAI